MRIAVATTLGGALLFGVVAHAQIDARMLRHPDVSQTQITFVYAGDIWVVEKTGGVAKRLSSPAGQESFPRFSPDGSEIAFSGNYDGNIDVYVVPSDGGVPRRITHHPASDRILDWYPDGESLLYASGMKSASQRFSQLYRTSRNGGHPERLPLAYAEHAALSGDGEQLVFQTLTREFRTWKRYRGGMAPDLWMIDFTTGESRRLTDDDANDSLPMLHGDTVYFLSDRDRRKRANLWALDLAGGDPRQVTNFRDDDVHFPSVGPSEIVFEAEGRLYLLDLETEKIDPVEIQVVTDRRTLKPYRKKVGDFVQYADISPSGKRAVFEARGEVFSVPAKNGVIRNLTRSSGVAERYPAWSPDGKTLAYWSDRTGEYELTLRPADGSGAERSLTKLGPGFRYGPTWSPDSKKIAFIDETFAIRLVDVETEEVEQIDSALRWSHGALSNFGVSWSADSRWMTYSRDLKNGNNAVFLYDTEEGVRSQVTAGFYSSSSPVFDPDGKYLYWVSQRNFEPSYSSVDESWSYGNSARLMAAPLRVDVASPIAPRNDEEEVEADSDEESDSAESAEEDGEGTASEEEDSDSEDADSDSEDSDSDSDEGVQIDVDGLERRAVVLPPDAARYRGLRAVSGKLVYLRAPRTGSGERQSSVRFWDLEGREEKTVLESSDGFTISADGKKLFNVSGDSFAIVDVKPDQKPKDSLATGDLEMTVDPRAEWRQIFNDAWRLERDYFYDPNLHGVKWDKMRTHYGELLEHAETRWDVSFVIGELIGELNASHAYRRGGDEEQADRVGVGLLGVDFSLENGAYRIESILEASPWDNDLRSPLVDTAGQVAEGDFLLAVNGEPIDTSLDPWAAFQGLAGKTVVLTVNDEPSVEGSREVLVKTLRFEAALRNREWVESNRRKVDEATGGRVGYIYVPNTGVGGQNELVRQFQGLLDKEGLIIDERFNSGGQIPDRFIELLSRRYTGFLTTRHGLDQQSSFTARTGPMVMLINHWAGSGGDLFPYLFKQAGLGPLIGTRTWGGLIGISGAPALIDGGGVTVPSFAFYDTDGDWLIEGHGVDPDIEVIDDPALTLNGGDPQLDRAIEEVLKGLDEQKPLAKKPKFEDRS